MALGASPALPGMLGKWYVAYSSLKMWKKGDKTNPVVMFSGMSDNGGTISWDDDVTFDQRGWFSSKSTPLTIVGTDTVTASDPLAFRWNGKGVLRLLHSNCKLLAHDPDFAEYAVVHFSATWMSEEGIDLLTRSDQPLAPERIKEIMATVDPATQQLVEKAGLAWTRTTPAAA